MGKEEKKGGERTKSGTVKIRCDGFVPVEAFEFFSQRKDSESCGDVSWEDLSEKPGGWSDCEPDSCVRVVPDVTDVPVSLSSVVTEFCDGFSCCSDWEDVEPQSFSFSKKRAHCCTDTREGMRYGGSTVITPPLSRKKNDAAHTSAKFVYLLCEGPRKVRRRRKRMEHDKNYVLPAGPDGRSSGKEKQGVKTWVVKYKC